jgi:hypothetical protein
VASELRISGSAFPALIGRVNSSDILRFRPRLSASKEAASPSAVSDLLLARLSSVHGHEVNNFRELMTLRERLRRHEAGSSSRD